MGPAASPHTPRQPPDGREADPRERQQRPSARCAPRRPHERPRSPRTALYFTVPAANQRAPCAAPVLRAPQSPGVTTRDSRRVGAGRRGGGTLVIQKMKLNFSHHVCVLLCKQLNFVLLPRLSSSCLLSDQGNCDSGWNRPDFSLLKNEHQRCVERRRRLGRRLGSPGPAAPPRGGHLLNTEGGARTTAGGRTVGVPADARVPVGEGHRAGRGLRWLRGDLGGAVRGSRCSCRCHRLGGPAHPAGTRVVSSRRFHSNCSRARERV